MVTQIVLTILLIVLVFSEYIHMDDEIKITWKEVIVSFLGYMVMLFVFMGFTGVLQSGYHFVDDHEMYTIGKDFTSYGYIGTMLKWMQGDLHSRFRFTYFLIRVSECYFFRDNYFLWHIFQTLIAASSFFLCYIFARKQKCPRWLAYSFSIGVFVGGGQSAVLWRLGPQECLGTLILIITLLLLMHYKEKKTKGRQTALIVMTILLGGIKEAFLLMLPILPILLCYWEMKEDNVLINLQNLGKFLRKEKIYTISTWAVFLIDLFIIILYVGTNKYGYAGIDQTYGIVDYLKGFYFITTGRLGLYLRWLVYAFLFLAIPMWIQSYRRGGARLSFWQPIWLSVMLLIYLIATQYVLHAKSTMYERYLLPSTIIISAFLLLEVYHFCKDTQWKNAYYVFAILACISLIGGVDDESRGILYAEDGKTTTAMLEYMSKSELEDADIIVDIDYEMDFSASVILQEKYGISNVYNMNYNKSDGDWVNDAYVNDSEKTAGIQIWDADVFMGYTRKIDLLLDMYGIDASSFHKEEFGDYGVYISEKWIQNRTNLLIVGDSIGEGAGASDPSLKWYKYLIPYVKEHYGDRIEVTNVSMGGNTSYAGYVRTMELDEGKDYDIVIVCYGENDKEENFPFYYEQLLQAIRGRWPSCQLITILESSQREYTPKMQDIQSLSAKYNAYVADTIAAFEGSGIAYEELCDDGTHPNDEGQKVYFHEISRVIDKIYLASSTKSGDGTLMPVEDAQQTLVSSTFCYYPADDFEKVSSFQWRIPVERDVKRIGIDYDRIPGHHEVAVLLDGEEIWDYSYDWNYTFEQRHIEAIENGNRCVNEVIVQFSSKEQMKGFHGIIIE